MSAPDLGMGPSKIENGISNIPAKVPPGHMVLIMDIVVARVFERETKRICSMVLDETEKSRRERKNHFFVHDIRCRQPS